MKMNALRIEGKILFVISLITGCPRFSSIRANLNTIGRITNWMSNNPTITISKAANPSVHVGTWTVGINHFIESHKIFTYFFTLRKNHTMWEFVLTRKALKTTQNLLLGGKFISAVYKQVVIQINMQKYKRVDVHHGHVL